MGTRHDLNRNASGQVVQKAHDTQRTTFDNVLPDAVESPILNEHE